MTAKRTIRGEQYNIEKLIDQATTAAGAGDLEDAAAYLRRAGHTEPTADLVARVAEDRAILAELQRMTGATFTGQIGKITFVDRNRAIDQVNAYLNRRNAGQRSRWGK